MTRLEVIGFLFTLIFLILNVHAKQGIGRGDQEWDYVEVRPGAHMFWWLYYTTGTKSYDEKPLLIWLQGGPGGSSTGFGNFEEIGPYDSNLNPRNTTWVNDYNVLFIDNPVGTGFSYAKSASAFAKTNAQIASDLMECMRSFYKKLPSFKRIPVYITSESYGGKMAAEFALVWRKAEKSGSIQSNLKGVGLGDSWISPEDSVMTWAPFLLNTGMIDTAGYNKIQKSANATRNAIRTGQWGLATSLWSQTEQVVSRVTAGIDFYNILTKVPLNNPTSLTTRDLASIVQGVYRTSLRSDASLSSLMNNVVKRELDLWTNWGFQSGQVFYMLNGDFMKPVVNIVERLLNETDLKVFVYTGQLDLIVDTPGTLQWVEKMKWRNSKSWKNSERTPVVVDGIIEGYRKSNGNFAFYWINRAGHMVPADNPAGTSALLKDLTSQ